MLSPQEVSGQQTWAKTYGAGGYEDARSIQQTSDGGYIAAGITNSFGAGSADAWLLKLDSNESIDPSCTFYSGSTSTVNNTTATAISSSISPVDSSVVVNDTSAVTTDSSAAVSLLCNNTIALQSHKPAIDDSAGSTPNGIIEPDEAVDLVGAIENIGSADAVSVIGHLTTFDPIAINNSIVTYPDIAAGTIAYSLTNYNITALLANRPSTHWDVVVTENPGCSSCNYWLYDFNYHVGSSFADVPPANLFYSFIETMLHSGVTSGCAATVYCPEMSASRQQMAKFICLAMEETEPGSCPTAPCAGIFDDVPASNIFCSHIEGLYNAGVVSGCQSTPLMYCPSTNVSRAQMAKFIVNAFGFLLY